VADISFLERAAAVGVEHDITGVGTSGNYIATNRHGRPITVSEKAAKEFERKVEERERAKSASPATE
jgi:hypothetical protein